MNELQIRPGDVTEAFDYDESPEEISNAFTGRKIANIEPINAMINRDESEWFRAEVKITLDDGSRLYAQPNYGWGGQGDGDYETSYITTLEDLQTLGDNIITKAEAIVERAKEQGDDSVYRLFVFTEHRSINLMSFTGDTGNGCYGAGFQLLVVRTAE